MRSKAQGGIIPIIVARVPQEPIIIATYTGILEATSVETVMAETTHLMASVQGEIFRIHDMHQVSHDFRRVTPFVRSIRSNAPASMTDPRIRPIYVGKHPMVRYTVSQLKDVRLDIPIFDTLDEALFHARQQFQQSVVSD